MIESPLLQEIEARARGEGRVEALLRVLEVRFGRVPEDIRSTVEGVRDERELDALIEAAVRCPDLAAFRARLPR
jgi:hypothetical protein